MCGDNWSSAVELKKDVTIVVLGASGDLAKKKTVLSSR
jgi:glucose-6-phosphate 1-dehydrogenase